MYSYFNTFFRLYKYKQIFCYFKHFLPHKNSKFSLFYFTKIQLYKFSTSNYQYISIFHAIQHIISLLKPNRFWKPVGF